MTAELDRRAAEIRHLFDTGGDAGAAIYSAQWLDELLTLLGHPSADGSLLGSVDRAPELPPAHLRARFPDHGKPRKPVKS